MKLFQWVRDKLLPKNRNLAVLTVAATQIGVMEWDKGSNPVIEKYLDFSTPSNRPSGLRDSVPWCAAYVAWALESAGMTSTNSLLARSYENWGVGVRHSPLPGDIIVFYRNSVRSGFGHVGFFLGFKNGNVLVLGGNQDNQVNVTEYSTARMTDIRRSSKQVKYSLAQEKELTALAHKIISGVKINPAGLVV